MPKAPRTTSATSAMAAPQPMPNCWIASSPNARCSGSKLQPWRRSRSRRPAARRRRTKPPATSNCLPAPRHHRARRCAREQASTQQQPGPSVGFDGLQPVAGFQLRPTTCAAPAIRSRPAARTREETGSPAGRPNPQPPTAPRSDGAGAPRRLPARGGAPCGTSAGELTGSPRQCVHFLSQRWIKRRAPRSRRTSRSRSRSS